MEHIQPENRLRDLDPNADDKFAVLRTRLFIIAYLTFVFVVFFALVHLTIAYANYANGDLIYDAVVLIASVLGGVLGISTPIVVFMCFGPRSS